MPKVVFVTEKRELEVPTGSNLRSEALKAGIQVNFYPLEIGNGFLGRIFNCRGFGHCGSCKVVVQNGKENLSPKGLMEKITLWRMFSAVGHEEDMRLACQCKVQGDCTVETRPEFNFSGENFWQKPYPNK